MKGILITFEGTEGSGKSTHVQLLAERLRAEARIVRVLREPGGTPIGEEIRHTLKHSQQNHAMTPEAELLLMNASRAQLVREVVRPALAAGEIVLCDRFYDSTIAYQGYGRRIDLGMVRAVVGFAVGDTRPDLTLFLSVPIGISEERRLARQQAMLLEVPTITKKPQDAARLPFSEPLRDRMEEADREFFERVEKGFKAIAAAEPERVYTIDSTQPLEMVRSAVWQRTERLLARVNRRPTSR